MKVWRILISLILMLLVFFIVQGTTLAENPHFDGGLGTESEPWLIGTAEQLDNLRHYLGPDHADKHFRLAKDIDLGLAPWNEVEGWVPIGAQAAEERFMGHFDGANYTIRNLTLERPASDYQGLFGFTEDATLENLRLENVRVHGRDRTGALAGKILTSNVENIHVTGVIRGRDNTGGIAGDMRSIFKGGAMQNVSVSASIHGNFNTGGLVGQTRDGALLYHSYSLGSVEGENRTGGLVGYHSMGTPIIADCYSRATVHGTQHVGGLVGSSIFGNIYRSYSTGAVTASTDTDIGGFLGEQNDPERIISCYWDTETSGQETSAGGDSVTGKTTEQMMQIQTYKDWNFHSLWNLDEGNDYPVHQDLGIYAKPRAVDLADLDGEGTADSPYIITTADELNAVRHDLEAHYRLGNDIDLSATVIWNGGEGWVPIGAQAERFMGHFDGANYTIRNLTLERPAADYQGLFGFTEDATLENLRLENVRVHGRDRTGALAGKILTSNVENIHVTGVIRGRDNTGGIAGDMRSIFKGGAMQNVSVSASIHGNFNTGGLVGQTRDGALLYHSYSLGSVEGENRTGGLVGYHSYGTPIIADCYSRATVHGTQHVGGLVGSSIFGNIYRSYSTGAVTASTDTDIGGFLGEQNDPERIISCYWDTETSGQETSAGGDSVTGKTTEQMMQIQTYKDWNFHSLWNLDEGNDYPVHQDLGIYAKPRAVDLADLDGEGTADSPYIITTADDLNAVRHDLEAHYRLGNDIDLSATVIWNGGEGWIPIGSQVAEERFMGHFDGANFTIRNLTLERPAADYQGLFGFTEDATLENLRLENVRVHGRDRTGALAGKIRTSNVENIYVTGMIRGRDNTGGVAGFMTSIFKGGVMQNISGLASVHGGINTGGLVGYTTNSAALYHSYSLGSVEGEQKTGGLVGYHSYGSPIIEDCYSRATVHGTQHVGGLVGRSIFGDIYRSYSAGAVTASTDTDFGGFLGEHNEPERVISCYWDTETSGQETSAGGAGVTGRTTVQMQKQATFAGWDFAAVWGIFEDNSYPFHRQTARNLIIFPTVRQHDNGASTGHVIYVNGNSAWTAEADDAWITITAGEAGNEEGVVTYSVGANPSPVQRTGTITVSNNEGLNLTYTVHQGVKLHASPVLFTHDAYPSSGHVFVVTGNTAWTAATGDTWITITDGAEGDRYGTVTYRLARNDSLNSRSGTITVSGSGVNRSVTVNQAGASLITPETFTVSVQAEPATGGTVGGGGTFSHGDEVTVTAAAGTGYEFVNWTENGTVVSTDPVYKFIITANRNLRANFKAVDPPDQDLDTTIYWQNTQTGLRYLWFMDGLEVKDAGGIGTFGAGVWNIVGVGDLDGDGKTDIVWHNTESGLLYAWMMDGRTQLAAGGMGTVDNLDWRATAVGDMNGNGSPDIIWENTANGRRLVWFMDGFNVVDQAFLEEQPDPAWSIVAAADMNGNGQTDLILQNAGEGLREVWLMNGVVKEQKVPFAPGMSPEWQIAAAGDLDHSGHNDIVWENHDSGLRYVWFMEELDRVDLGGLGTISDMSWQIVGLR